VRKIRNSKKTGFLNRAAHQAVDLPEGLEEYDHHQNDHDGREECIQVPLGGMLGQVLSVMLRTPATTVVTNMNSAGMNVIRQYCHFFEFLRI
jgi:hypothetical protein